MLCTVEIGGTVEYLMLVSAAAPAILISLMNYSNRTETSLPGFSLESEVLDTSLFPTLQFLEYLIPVLPYSLVSGVFKTSLFPTL
jgi:hypothetical protein